MRGVLSARRLPRLFFDLVNVYFFHAAFVIPTGVEESLTISVSQFWFHSEIARDVSTEPVLSEVERARHDHWLLFAIEVICLLSFHAHFFQSILHHRPFAAVGVVTGITY